MGRARRKFKAGMEEEKTMEFKTRQEYIPARCCCLVFSLQQQWPKREGRRRRVGRRQELPQPEEGRSTSFAVASFSR